MPKLPLFRLRRPGSGAVLAFLLLLGPLVAAENPSSRRQIDYRLIITGGELLHGAYPDAHTHFLTRTLHPLGWHCVVAMIVDDEPANIKEALRFQAKVPLVIVTGGLGPTQNDVTRETLADYTGIPLAEQPEVLAEMERRFKVPRDQLRPNLRKQTRVPTRGTYLKNPNGTAVGLVFEMGEQVIVALPGPPRELQPMVRNYLIPYLNRRFGSGKPGCSILLRFVGLGQSQIDQTLKQHVPQAEEFTVYSGFEGGRVDFQFSLREDTPKNRARLQDLKQQIEKHLADWIYAEDESSLEEHVAGLLQKGGETLALAEVGSGGSLAAALAGAPSAAKVLAGAYLAPTEEKLRRLLRVPDDHWTGNLNPVQKAEMLAAATGQGAGSRWTVAVGEVQADPGGNRTVTVVFQRPNGKVESQAFPLRGNGELARSGLTTQILDGLRRKLR